MSTYQFATAILLTAALALIPCASADETTFCNTYITSLPYTITTQGHYCFDRNLSTSITSGAAITIAVDFVLLDLNNFKLGGGAAGAATRAVGILALQRSNITIRNGNIRGFAFGILMDAGTATGSQNITIENNVLDGNTVAAINVFASNYSIRNNQVYNTGGTTSTVVRHCQVNPPYVTGISTIGGATFGECLPGGNGEVVGNTVSNTTAVGGGVATSIHANSGGMVIGNRLMGQTGGSNGIVAWVCRDNTAHSMTPIDPYFGCNQLVGINSDN